MHACTKRCELPPFSVVLFSLASYSHLRITDLEASSHTNVGFPFFSISTNLSMETNYPCKWFLVEKGACLVAPDL